MFDILYTTNEDTNALMMTMYFPDFLKYQYLNQFKIYIAFFLVIFSSI